MISLDTVEDDGCALNPIHVTFDPVVNVFPAPVPMAVFENPDVVFCNALAPIDIF
jgi:hypothetical protein